MIQLCRYMLCDNRRCGQPALHNTRYCRHHRNAKNWKRRSGLRSQIESQVKPTQTYDHGTILVPDRLVPDRLPDPGDRQPDSVTWENPVDLEFPEDPAAILTNIYRVTTLLVQGHIDRPTANSVTYGMQVCLSALNGKSLFAPATAAPTRSRSRDADPDTETTSGCPASGPSDVGSRPVHRVILTPDGDEIAPPLEILEENEAEPIHHKGCPCLLCAEKYRNHPPEEHHPSCQCGLCEEQIEEQITERSTQSTESATTPGAPQPALSLPKGPDSGTWDSSDDARVPHSSTASGLEWEHCALIPRKRVARAASLLSGSTRDPLNRPWSVAEYTFGDAIRRHEAQYAARAAAALAAGIEPPPYEPFTTGLLHPGTPEYEEDQQMQQHSNNHWASHFRNLIAERHDVQQQEVETTDPGATRADSGTWASPDDALIPEL